MDAPKKGWVAVADPLENMDLGSLGDELNAELGGADPEAPPKTEGEAKTKPKAKGKTKPKAKLPSKTKSASKGKAAKAKKGKGKSKTSKGTKPSPTAGPNAEVDGEILSIKFKDVVPNQNPERDPKSRDPELSGLTESLDRDGQKVPILVKVNSDGKYEVVEGDRRLKAMKKLKTGAIRGIVVSDDDGLTGIMTNLHRKAFSPMEEARALKSLLDRKVFKTKTALAKAFGWSDARVHQKLGLLNLDPDIQRDVEKGKVAPSVAEQASKSKKAQGKIRKTIKKGKKPKGKDLRGMTTAAVPSGDLPKDSGMSAVVLSDKVRVVFLVDAEGIGATWEIHKTIQGALRKLQKNDFRKTVKRLRKQITD